MLKNRSLLLILIFSLILLSCNSSHPRSAYDPGNNLLPVPQQISFTGKRFAVDKSWTISAESMQAGYEPSVKSLQLALKEKGGIESAVENKFNKSKQIRLSMKKGCIVLPAGLSDSISNQAYKLSLKRSGVTIEANSASGLYYGTQTLIQLFVANDGRILLPEGEITDWPDLGMRMIYWDCAHHLDRIETFRLAIDRASHYKINALALKLEGHFQFKSAQPVIEPNAFTPEEYQELTDYAREHFVQLVPYLDAPAHVAFILKHPEYKSLRAIPNSNYELSITNEGTFNLLSGMFGDLIEANKGGKYILLSTDEAYYAGKAEGEKEAAKKAGSNGRLLASFITRVAGDLHGKGRTVISWCEYPLTMPDIEALPQHLVNGVFNEEWAPAFRQRGIRQFIYTSTQGEEPLFPEYYRVKGQKGRVEEILETVRTNTSGGTSEIPGIIVAAWGDSGLHPETFWLGYAAGTAAAWNLKNLDAGDLTNRFFKSFYGDEMTEMAEVYSLLSSQARFWKRSWLSKPLNLRTPIVGNSRGIFDKPRPASDQTLPLLPVPAPGDLSVSDDQFRLYIDTLKVEDFRKENDLLLRLLDMNLQKGQSHNLEIYRSIAMLCRQNIDMLSGLNSIDSLVRRSSELVAHPDSAIALLDAALSRAKLIIEERTNALRSVEKLWYTDWYPLVAEANGRKFLFSVDDVKDHLPGRTPDLSYLVYRQLNYPLEKWIREVTGIRNSLNQN